MYVLPLTRNLRNLHSDGAIIGVVCLANVELGHDRNGRAAAVSVRSHERGLERLQARDAGIDRRVLSVAVGQVIDVTRFAGLDTPRKLGYHEDGADQEVVDKQHFQHLARERVGDCDVVCGHIFFNALVERPLRLGRLGRRRDPAD